MKPDGSINTLVQFSRIVPERKQAEGCLTDLKMQHIARAFHEVVDWDQSTRLKVLNLQSMSKKTKE